MGNKQNSPKDSYYELFKKEIKNSYDTIKLNKYNKKYSINANKLIGGKKTKNKNQTQKGDMKDWKAYILDKLYCTQSKNWKNSLFNFIINDFDIKNDEIYNYENKIFIQQFVLLSFPQLHLGDEEMKKGPILSLFSPEELKTYSIRSKKKSKNKTKKNNNRDFNRLTIGTVMDGEMNIESSNFSDIKNQNQYNSYKIREHINIIQSQLKEERHPINIIIKKFYEIYAININKSLEILRLSNSMNDIEKKKYNVIKDIQKFIKIISMALKYFYAKSINYKFFVNERDEFFNLVCFILFNKKHFYNSVFELFELSNKQKTEDLIKKVSKLGKLTPKEAGVSIKFCLDEESKNFRDKQEYNKKKETTEAKRKKTGIVGYFERVDFLYEHMNSFTKQKVNFDISNNLEFDLKRTITHFDDEHNQSKKDNDTDIKEEKSIERTLTVQSYKTFSEVINSPNTTLIEKYQEELDENPSQLDVPSIKSFKSYQNMPYGEVISYINTIKDYNTPLDKLTIIALSSVLITDCINDFWRGAENLKERYLNIDADQLMSIFLYVIYNMNLSSIYTQLDFINFFTGEKTKKSMVGYYYTTIEGCLNFIMSVKTKDEFNENAINNYF